MTQENNFIYKKEGIMKTQKRTLWVLLALMQAAVLILLILQIVELAPRRWKLN